MVTLPTELRKPHQIQSPSPLIKQGRSSSSSPNYQHHFFLLLLVQSFILTLRLGSLGKSFPPQTLSLPAGLTPRILRPFHVYYSAHRLDLFAWCVRLSRLSVGFRTHLGLQRNFFIWLGSLGKSFPPQTLSVVELFALCDIHYVLGCIACLMIVDQNVSERKHRDGIITVVKHAIHAVPCSRPLRAAAVQDGKGTTSVCKEWLTNRRQEFDRHASSYRRWTADNNHNTSIGIRCSK